MGGEGLPGDALRQWRNGPLGSIRLDNLYGPTETTIACMYRETRAQDEEQAIVSIGGPYPSRSVQVCDADGNDVDVAVTYRGYSDPGCTYGPVEMCYPPEGEIEFLSCKDEGGNDVTPTDKETERLEELAYQNLEES